MKALRTCRACNQGKPPSAFRAPQSRRCQECCEAPPPPKVCTSCGETKPAAAFRKRHQRCEACLALPFPSEVPKPRGCYRCHEVKPADAFAWGKGGRKYRRRSGVCKACRRAERKEKRLAAEARRATWTRRDGVTMRRCSGCHEPQVLRLSFYVSHPEREGPSAYAYECIDCVKVRVSAYARRIRQDPERGAEWRARKAEVNRRWRAENPEKALAAQRRWRRAVLADPVRAARHREAARMGHRLRREREGVPLAEVRALRVELPPEAAIPSLPAAPLARALEDFIAAVAEYGPEGKPIAEPVLQRMGLEARSYYAWRVGERERLQFDQADRALTGMGLQWWDVWPPADFPTVAEFLDGDLVAA